MKTSIEKTAHDKTAFYLESQERMTSVSLVEMEGGRMTVGSVRCREAFRSESVQEGHLLGKRKNHEIACMGTEGHFPETRMSSCPNCLILTRGGSHVLLLFCIASYSSPGLTPTYILLITFPMHPTFSLSNIKNSPSIDILPAPF